VLILVDNLHMILLWVISQHSRDVDLLEVKDSLVISLLVDESTDRSLEQHLIVYICNLCRDGLGPPPMQFVGLSSDPQATSEIFYRNVIDLLEELEWPLEKIVALATDGAASMTGMRQSLVGKLHADVPTLTNVHCIAHR
jgi:hypothetical protein